MKEERLDGLVFAPLFAALIFYYDTKHRTLNLPS